MQHKKLIAYFDDYKVQRIGLTMGIRKLQNIIRETCEHNPDNLLGAFGELFPLKVRFYIYPAREQGSNELITAQNLQAPANIHFLYDYLLENKNIVDIQRFNPDILGIYHKEVLKMIQEGIPGWEEKVPEEVARLVKEKRLFGYKVVIRY